MRNLRTSGCASVFVGVVLLALGPGLAVAADVMFLDVSDPNPVTVLHSGFDCGATFTVSGESAHFDGCWFTTSPVGSGAADAIMVETAADANAGTVSDNIHIQFTVVAQPGLPNEARISIDFRSLPTGTPPSFPPAGFPVLVEDGTLQLLNGYFVDAATPGPPFDLLPPPANIQIIAQSDAGTPTSIRSTTWGSVKIIYR
jgi:hypothetical protein